MLKQLTIVALTAALLPACILTTDNTSITNSNSNTESASDTDTTGTSDNSATDTSGTSDEPNTTGTSDEPTSSTTDTPTTDEPDTTGTTEVATDATTGNSGFGMCGWHARMNFYACAADGATPGAEDPLAEAPIACADGLVVGEKCDDDNGPVGGLGCCTPTGDLYYCNVTGDNTIAMESCGA
jgi:hypothetical protein